MKKKKSKKKHKKHSHHHHSHHHHSHHKHRSSCSHHSSKSIVPTDIATTSLPIANQLQSPPLQTPPLQTPPLQTPQLQPPQLQPPQLQPQYMMDTNSLTNEFNPDPQPPQILAIEPSLMQTQQSPQQLQINQQQSQLPPNLSMLPNTSISNQPQVLDLPINTTPITSPTNCAVINNESNLNSNLFNSPPFSNNFSSCSMVNNNMINTVVSPLSNETNNFVSSMPPQQPISNMETSSIDNQNSLDQTMHQIQTSIPSSSIQQTISQSIPQSISQSIQQSIPQSITQSIPQSIQQQLSPIQTGTIVHQAQQPQQQLIRAPIGVKPIVKTQFQSLLDYLLKQLEKRDSQKFFFWPVTDLIAPGYSSIITKPMDFSKIRQKINMNLYENLIQFRSDVKLMCDNAKTYNRPDTIYYKAARKLWHYAREKIFNRDSVLELVKLYQGVTNYELGLTCADYTDSEQINVPSYDDFTQMNEQLMPEQQTQFQFMSSSSNNNKSQATKLNINEEDMTPDQILDEVRKTAQEAADRLSLAKPNGSHYTLLRQLDDGTTTLAIVGSNVNGYQDEKYVNLESMVGKLNEGAPHLPGFKESELNTVRPIEAIETSPFSSYLPNSDSSKANLTGKESSLLLSTYGDEIGLAYSHSLLKFASGSDYVLTMVDSLLDALTNGQHTKLMDELKENRMDNQNETDASKNEDVEMKDAENGTDGEPIKKEGKESVEQKLNETSSLVTELESAQNQRLSSSTLPVKPNKDEIKIANLLSNKLTELISTYTTPADVTDLKSIRKALGVQLKSEITNT